MTISIYRPLRFFTCVREVKFNVVVASVQTLKIRKNVFLPNVGLELPLWIAVRVIDISTPKMFCTGKRTLFQQP